VSADVAASPPSAVEEWARFLGTLPMPLPGVAFPFRRADEASELWDRTGELDLLSVADLRALPLPSSFASLTDAQLL
jgi:hypothetical protein